jgi:hypothetical protein
MVQSLTTGCYLYSFKEQVKAAGSSIATIFYIRNARLDT